MLRALASGVTMVAGTVAILGLVAVMNRGASAPTAQRAERTASFQVAPRKQPDPPARPPPPPRPEQRPRAPRAAAPPTPMLAAELGGVSFGLPSLDQGGLGADPSALLGPDRKASDLIMTASSVDTPPRPTVQAAAVYPPRAHSQGVGGTVTLSLLIGTSGEVLQVRVVGAEPRGVFEEAATAAVRRWRFEPARYQGQAVKVWARQDIEFRP